MRWAREVSRCPTLKDLDALLRNFNFILMLLEPLTNLTKSERSVGQVDLGAW